MKNVKVLAICFLVVFIVAVTGSIFTSGGVNTQWYRLIKPSITPPNYVFPIVWTVLFILIALCFYLSFVDSKNKKMTALVYGINLDLNMLWTMLFFKFRNAFAGFLCIILLWISICIMIFHSAEINRKAGWMLFPYLAWVTFAGVLNYLAMIKLF